MTTSRNVAVLGAGSWGTALAILLARNGHRVRLWGRDSEQMAAMASTRRNRRYLPDIELPDRLEPTADLSFAMEQVEAVLSVVPSQAFRPTLESIQPLIGPGVPLFWGTKGLEAGSGRYLLEVANEVIDGDHPFGIVSGPTFAAEVAKGLPTAVTVASESLEVANAFARLLHCTTFRTYTCADMVGVQIGGAAKNVLAIAAGIADGLGFGANTRSALITRGLAELMRVGVAAGGEPETFMGLAGLGDLILTCTDDQSRNRRLGLALGRGEALSSAVAAIGQSVEGVKAAPEVYNMAQRLGVEMPIIEQVCLVLQGEVSPQAAVENLLTRESKMETG